MVDQINNDYIERKNIYEKIDETNKIINNLNQEIIELKDKNIKLQNKNIKLQNENIKIQNENNDLLRKNNCIQSELTDYKKGKLYKICTKIYKIKSGGKRCEKKQ